MFLTQIFGQIQPPPAVARFAPTTLNPLGLTRFIGIIISALIVGAGLYFLLNVITAGYQFLSSGDDPKGVSSAWAKIYQSIIGLIIVAAAVLLTSVISLIFFGTAGAIMNITLYGPQ